MFSLPELMRSEQVCFLEVMLWSVMNKLWVIAARLCLRLRRTEAFSPLIRIWCEMFSFLLQCSFLWQSFTERLTIIIKMKEKTAGSHLTSTEAQSGWNTVAALGSSHVFSQWDSELKNRAKQVLERWRWFHCLSEIVDDINIDYRPVWKSH